MIFSFDFLLRRNGGKREVRKEVGEREKTKEELFLLSIPSLSSSLPCQQTPLTNNVRASAPGGESSTPPPDGTYVLCSRFPPVVLVRQEDKRI